MNARELQEAVCKDIEELFRGDSFQTVDGGMTGKVRTFRQYLPRLEAENEETLFPFVIVKVDCGKIESPTEAHRVRLLLWAGVHDDNPENNGHLGVLEILERIQQHYQEQPALGPAVAAHPFEWAMQDEESFPFFYGGCYVYFDLPAPRSFLPLARNAADDWRQFT